jgi:hypothetical protein
MRRLILGALEGLMIKKGRSDPAWQIRCSVPKQLSIGSAKEYVFGERVKDTAARKVDFDFGGVRAKDWLCCKIEERKFRFRDV